MNDQRRSLIRTINLLCILVCTVLSILAVATARTDLIRPSNKRIVSFVMMAVYIASFAVNMSPRTSQTIKSSFMLLTFVVCECLSTYATTSPMVFAILAMFSAGIVYFNCVKIIHIWHALINSLILILFSFALGSGIGSMLFPQKFFQFELVEVIASIVGIIIADVFFISMLNGRMVAEEAKQEQDRSMDELLKIIEAKADEATNATRSKSDFLASMSHEIRTPINSILGMNEMINRETREPEIRKYSEDIVQAGNMLMSLVNNILDFSTIESGKMEILPVKYDLGMLINDLRIFTANRAEKKGLKFVIDCVTDVPRLLHGDEIRIKQIISNMLTNAVKYTEKGTVTLKIDYDKADERSVFLKVAVVDTGRGMRQEDMEKLFKPFERIEEIKNRHIEGTGLGMNIVQQLLTLMGSKLEVTSEYGKGSTFHFVIRQEVVSWKEIGDVNVAVTEKQDQTSIRSRFTAPDAKILVVDDIAMNLNVFAGLLKRTKIKITKAASGEEAIEKARETEFDILFIDHMMPEMDGIETMERIKKDRFALCRNKPMVALTANAISGAREFYLEKGFANYLSKPIDSKSLEKMIMELLPQELVISGPDATGGE